MKIETTGMVYGCTRFTSDNGDQYASVFMVEETEHHETDKLGILPFKTPSAYGLIDTMRKVDFPVRCKIVGEMITAGGGKGGLHIHELHPEKSPQTPTKS